MADRLDGVKVLLVDDEPDTREVMSLLLAQTGAEVRSAGSAEEAMSVVADFLPDVVASDVAMPGEDSYALLARLRIAVPEVPALALTAYTRPEDRRRARGRLSGAPEQTRRPQRLRRRDPQPRPSGVISGYGDRMGQSLAERQHTFTFEEYTLIAERSSPRLEFWEGVILDMSGGSPRHSKICANITAILQAQLWDKPCQPFDANLKVRSVAANRATYADVTVICGPLQLDPADKTKQTVLNPTVLVEVLSPTTESDDRGPKLDAYRTIASVRLVLLVAQDKEEVTVYERHSDGRWSETKHSGGVVPLDAVGCTLPLDRVYSGLPA